MTAYLNALGVICALGRGQAEVSRSLFAGDCSGMAACRAPLEDVLGMPVVEPVQSAATLALGRVLLATA